MATTEKKKVINIETGKSTKNVKTLKQQIKELKEEMALLEQGTEAYRKAGVKLANLNQKQIEIQESMKYSNKDIGQTLSNLTNVATGAVASINAVSASMQLLGIDSDESGEALKNIQLTMAIIQGFSAMDTAVKSLDGLKDAFLNVGKSSSDVQDALEKTEKGVTHLGDARKGLQVATEKSAGAELTEATALADNTAEMQKNNEKAEEYTTANETNRESTIKSTAAIIAKTKAEQGDVTALEELNGVLDRNKTALERQAESYQKTLDASNALQNSVLGNNVGADASEIERSEALLKDYQSRLNIVERMSNKLFGSEGDYFRQSYMQFKAALGSATKFGDYMLNDIDTAKKMQEQFETLGKEIKKSFEGTELYGDVSETIDDFTKTTKNAVSEIDRFNTEWDDLKQQIEETEKVQNKQNQTTKNTTKCFEDVEEAAKKGSSAVASFGKSLLTSLGIGAVLTLVTVGISKLIDKIKEYNEERYASLRLEGEVQKSIAEQVASLKALEDTLFDVNKTSTATNTTLEERKIALEQIKKIVPEYHAQLTDEGKLYNDNREALDQYNQSLYNRIKYQALEEKLKEIMKEEADAKEKLAELEDATFYKLARQTRWQNKLNDLQQKELDIMEQMKEVPLTDVFKDEDDGDGPSATVTLKTYIEYLKEIETILKNIWGTYYDEQDLESVFQRYDPAKMFRDGIGRIMKDKADVSDMFTDWFKGVMENGMEGVNPNDLTLGMIFKQEDVDGLEKQIEDLIADIDKLNGRYANQKNLTEAQTKQWEKEKKALQDRIDVLRNEQSAVKETVNRSIEEAKVIDEQNKKVKALVAERAKYVQQLDIESEYQAQLADRSGYYNAEVDKTIKTLKLEQSEILNVIAADEERLAFLKKKTKAELTKAEYDEIIALEQELFNKNKELDEKETQIEQNEHTKRLNNLDQYYKGLEAKQAKYANDRSNSATANGWGTQDYNVQIDTLMSQLQLVQDKIAALKEQEGITEGERLQRQLELEQEYADLSVQIDQEKVNRKININQTYYNALSQLSSGVSSLLSAEMENYDENSEQYKKMQIANAWIDTLSGTLSAFMSGMQSGIPAPWNVGLATTLAALTFAAGQAQIKNIENGTTSNSMSVSTPTTTYETLAYQNQSELLGNIADTKVYVTESDITTTQNRVRVRESNARY